MAEKVNKTSLLILGLILIIGIGAILFASNVNPEDIQPKADVDNLPVERKTVPTLDTSLGWLNTEGLSEADLKGKVVVYDFWTYSCINCQRTLPYLRAIWDRYEKDGLIIIGIHSPEFDFEKVDSNVENATKKYRVNWPVLFDDNKVTWDNFENQYWPAKYISDKQGRIRYHHYGEGRYEETEDVIRKLLGVKNSSPRAVFPGADKTKQDESAMGITPELYINPFRGDLNAEIGKSTITEAVEPDLNQLVLFGSVDVQKERTVLVEKKSKLTLNYQAAEVNLVAEPPGEGEIGELLVTLDSKPIPKEMRGKEVLVDSDGNTYVEVSSSDLIHVIKANKISQHILEFTARTPNISLYAFTFGR